MSDSSLLAINGGEPVRKTMLPYGRQSITDEDVEAVAAALRGDFLTTGPAIPAFEKEFASFVGSAEAVAVSNGTAALHSAMYALGIGEGDEVIVPALTFVATANAVVMQGGTPVLADVNPQTLLLDPEEVEKKITKKTKAVIAVDYAGQACDYDALHATAKKNGMFMIADACHALGGSYKGKQVGAIADLNTFSFHPVKPLTTGEGGMITTDNAEWAERMRRFRNHGISKDARMRQENATWEYEIEDLGYNYRLTDVQCVLGQSQLKRLPQWVERRNAIASQYDAAFADFPHVQLIRTRDGVVHGRHLYVILLRPETLTENRTTIFAALRKENIGVNVHYIPVHMLAYYQKVHGYKIGQFPVTEDAYARAITLPLFADMGDADAQDVIAAVKKVCTAYAR